MTGHGAADYLDHEAFEAAGVSVEYMAYSKTPWPRQEPGFTPFASVLDLIANTGGTATNYVRAATIGWRAFKRQLAANAGGAGQATPDGRDGTP